MNTAGVDSSPAICREKAGRPGATDAHPASCSPRLLRRQGAPIRRGCPWLRAARHRQPGATVNRRSVSSETVHRCRHTLPVQRSSTVSNHSIHCPREPTDMPSIISCTWYTIRGLTFVNHARMILLHQSSALRDVPFRLYGSLRAVNVLLASCAPHCTALAAPSAGFVWFDAGAFHVWRNHAKT